MASKMKKTGFPGVYIVLATGRFCVRATVSDPRTGKRVDKMKTCRAGTTEGGAIRAQNELKAQLLVALEEEARRKLVPITLAEYAERWLVLKAKRSRASRMANLQEILGERILPQLGHMLVTEIVRRDVEEWVVWAERVNKVDGSGYSQQTVLTWWRTLCSFLRDAIADLGVPLDPTRRIRGPHRTGGKRRERRTLSAEQLQKLLTTVERFFPQRYPEVLFLAMTGVRVGELYALQWNDIEFDDRRVLIRRSVWRGIVGPTKTVDPRIVPLHTEVEAVLKQHRLRLEATDHPGLASKLVFPSDSGTHRSSSSLHKSLAMAAEHVGTDIKVTPQVLRRTFNTLLVLAGVDRIVQRSMMGHSSEQMTERYSGISIDAKHRALERMLGQVGA